MRRTTTTAVVVGIFFVVGVLLLIWFSVRVQGAARKNTNRYYVEFDKVDGLQEGAAVTLAGVEVGSVASLRYDQARRKVVVELAVDRQYALRREDCAAVQMRSLLGQYFVNIKPGDPTAPIVPPGETLKARRTADLGDILAALGGKGDEASGLIQSLDANLTSLSTQISEVIGENRENLRRATEAFAKAAPKIEALASSITVAAASFADIADALRNGEGTLGKLLKDDRLYYDLSDTVEDLRAITTKIRNGEGSLGRLVNDDTLHGEAEQTFASFREAAEAVRDILEENRTDISKALASLGKMGDDMGRAADNLVVITEKIRNGEGTLGMLVNDRTLYDEIRSTIDQVRRTFEQTEEQSVVRTFLGIVLGAAQ